MLRIGLQNVEYHDHNYIAYRLLYAAYILDAGHMNRATTPYSEVDVDISFLKNEYRILAYI